jgi:excisionase family DNA binding protein
MSSSNDHTKGAGESLWSAADVAQYLRVSRSWVYHRVAAGEIPCIHLGPLVRFDPEIVRAYARGVPAPRAKILPFRRPSSGRDPESK